MKALKRTLVSVIVACVVALFITLVASAGGPYYISENTLYYMQGPTTSPIRLSNANCYGGQCRYLYQSSSSPSTYRWEYTRANMYYLWAYCPGIGEAAARYWWRTYRGGYVMDNWYITMNQSNPNNKNKFVYLGFADYLPNDCGELRLSNQCVSGYWCGGLKVYWDNMKYTTSP